MVIKKLALAAVFVPTLLSTALVQAENVKKPNVLVIVADDLGFSDTGHSAVKSKRQILKNWQMMARS